ncbi:hypothetical protein GGI21_005836, partial [Coemansia aciculifera]
MSQIEQLASELSSLLRGEADGLEGISRSFLEAKLASLRHNDPSSSADDLKRLLFDVIDASLAEQVGLAGTTAVLQELVCLVGQPEQGLGVRAQQDV